MNLTEASKNLFLAYAEDSGNWGGTPLVGGNVCLLGEKEDRGNLTQLKRAQLLSTFRSDGCTWVEFTVAGREYAKQHGINL